VRKNRGKINLNPAVGFRINAVWQRESRTLLERRMPAAIFVWLRILGVAEPILRRLSALRGLKLPGKAASHFDTNAIPSQMAL
jgi:hypothetical protein